MGELRLTGERLGRPLALALIAGSIGCSPRPRAPRSADALECPAGAREVRVRMVVTEDQGCRLERPGVAPRSCTPNQELEFCGLRFRPGTGTVAIEPRTGQLWMGVGDSILVPKKLAPGQGIEVKACARGASYDGPAEVWILRFGERAGRVAMASGVCIGDRREGEWVGVSYDMYNGLQKHVGFYVRGSPIVSVRMDATGRLRELGGYIDGNQHGIWKEWDHSGELRAVREYDQGKLIRTTWYPDRAPGASRGSFEP